MDILTLTTTEASQLQAQEKIIERGLKTFSEVGNALAAIRDARLYRADFGTFEEYCQTRWNMGKAYAFRLIVSAEVSGNLSPIGDILPATESQARPLARLAPEAQREVWQDVVNNAPKDDDGKPKITAKLVAEAVANKEARRENFLAAREEKIAAIIAKNEPLETQKRYSVVAADPPWRYDFSVSTTREIENQYPTMTLDDICALPVCDVCADDCVLFLWATSPKLQEAFDVLRAWGFEYKTSMVWIKDKIGMGYYARQQHEIILIATRGNIPTPAPENRPPSIIIAERGRHSEKPQEFYGAIERMYPEYERLEMFARAPRAGWEVWGNESK